MNRFSLFAGRSVIGPAAVFLCIAFTMGSLNATSWSAERTMRPYQAEYIFDGTLVEATTEWFGGRLITLSRIQINHCIHGCKDGQIFELYQVGGQKAGYESHLVDVPHLAVGTHAFFFVNAVPRLSKALFQEGLSRYPVVVPMSHQNSVLKIQFKDDAVLDLSHAPLFWKSKLKPASQTWTYSGLKDHIESQTQKLTLRRRHAGIPGDAHVQSLRPSLSVITDQADGSSLDVGQEVLK